MSNLMHYLNPRRRPSCCTNFGKKILRICLLFDRVLTECAVWFLLRCAQAPAFYRRAFIRIFQALLILQKSFMDMVFLSADRALDLSEKW